MHFYVVKPLLFHCTLAPYRYFYLRSEIWYCHISKQTTSVYSKTRYKALCKCLVYFTIIIVVGFSLRMRTNATSSFRSNDWPDCWMIYLNFLNGANILSIEIHFLAFLPFFFTYAYNGIIYISLRKTDTLPFTAASRSCKRDEILAIGKLDNMPGNC